MPPTMNFSPGGRRGRTPSERAAADAARAQAAEQRAREQASPGPQAYNPGRGPRGRNATLADMRGENASSSFLSKSTRAKAPPYDPAPQTGDPGAYNPRSRKDGTNDTLADMRGENIRSSAFHSKTDRTLDGSMAGGRFHTGHFAAAGPGPCGYSPGKGPKGGNATMADMRGESGLAVFKSKTDQRPVVKQRDVKPGIGARRPRPLRPTTHHSSRQPRAMRAARPASRVHLARASSRPGAYSPGKNARGDNMCLADMRGESDFATMKSKSPQFTALKTHTGLGLGPGAYTPLKTKSGDNSWLADDTGENNSAKDVGSRHDLHARPPCRPPIVHPTLLTRFLPAHSAFESSQQRTLPWAATAPPS